MKEVGNRIKSLPPYGGLFSATEFRVQIQSVQNKDTWSATYWHIPTGASGPLLFMMHLQKFDMRARIRDSV